MNLELKKQFIGSKIIQQTKVGQIIFDADIVNKSEYEWYYKNGFENIFEIIEEPIQKQIKYKGIKEDGKDK